MTEVLQQWIEDTKSNIRRALMQSLEDRAPIDVHHHGYNHGYLQALKDVSEFFKD